MATEIRKEQKILAKKGDFPLEIRVFFDEKGIVKNVNSSAAFRCPEDLDDEDMPNWNIFNGAPDKIKFGDEYKKADEETTDGLKVVRYKNITSYT